MKTGFPAGPSGAGQSELPSKTRLILLVGIIIATLLAWIYLLQQAALMPAMGNMAMKAVPKAWTPVDAAAMLVMWWVMMAGMMLPSATSMILIFATINRRKRERGEPHVATLFFTSGYLVAWGGYSVLATGVQWGLEQLTLLSPMMVSTSPVFGGTLLIAAGLYQFTPFKHACLHLCRSPFDFVLNHWRDGSGGAFGMGIEHGLYCLGCCWVTMALLFVFGVMNLVWVAALTILVLMEKALPGGMWIARLSGIAMMAAGAWMIVSSA